MANPFGWGITKIKELNNAIWHTRLSETSRRRGFLIRYIRTILLAARGFTQDRVRLRATSLTFYTLLSIIPMVAIAFAIAKGFGLDTELERELTKEFASQQEVLSWIMTNAREALQVTKGVYLAGVGVIILLWSVMQLLDHIENSFNHIWQIKQSRPWTRKFTDYLAIMLIAPLFLILASSTTVFISTNLATFIKEAPVLEFFKPFLSFLFRLAPYFIMWMVLTLAYIVLPNTKVKFGSALLAGIVAGTLVQVVQWIYIDLQFGITRLNAIYGSFAAIPLFIVWIQTTWLIVLLGAELSFANQNVLRYEFESDALNISNNQKKILTILIMHSLVRNFREGMEPPGAETVASNLKIPVRIANEILHELGEAGLISTIMADQNKQRTFQPAIDINLLTVGFVFERLDRKGTEHTTVMKGREYERVVDMLNQFGKLVRESPENILIKDL